VSNHAWFHGLALRSFAFSVHSNRLEFCKKALQISMKLG